MNEDIEIEIQYILINEYGEFTGEVMIVNEEQLGTILELSKSFYEGGFELNCEDGSFVVFPPEVVRRSILKINRKKVEKDV